MSLQCWKCGAAIATQLPLPRGETCPSCRAQLHACRMCRHFDASRAGQCRELAADPVSDKVSANWCGWFVPRPDAYKGGGAAIAQKNRAALDALFGASDGASQKDSALFGASDGASQQDSALFGETDGTSQKDSALPGNQRDTPVRD